MLHPHQIEYLNAELPKAGIDLSAVIGKPCPLPKRLLAVSFVRQEKFDRVLPKMRGAMRAVSDEYAAQFPSGVPGIPNMLRADDWAQLNVR